jgi:hypothetical protein
LKNIYNILENLILEQASRTQAEESIEKKQRVRIYYDPTINRTADEEDKNERGYRNIEVYVLGMSKKDNPIVRCYQINGVSETDTAGWKTFRLDRITMWRPYPSFFYEPISDRDRTVPTYREDGDDGMITIYKQAKF